MRCSIAILCCLLTVCSFAQEDDYQDELVLSTPDQFASITGESSTLIGGLISPMSGQLSLKKTDLIVKGAQNISLARVYIPPYMPTSFPKHEHSQQEYDKLYLHRHLAATYKGWQFLPHLRLELNPKLMEVRLRDPNGATLDFKLSGLLASPSYAINNVAGETPSGKYDPRNTNFSYEENGNKIVVYAPDGTIRFYAKSEHFTKTFRTFLLQKEILPNGKVLRYQYDSRGQPTYIESLDPTERYVYASLSISGSQIEGKYHFVSSSGTTVDYGYQRRNLHAEIKEKNKKRYHTEKYDLIYNSILTSVTSPFYRHETLDYCGRFLLCSYSGKDQVFSTEQAGFGDVPHYRVHKLSLPVGQNDAMQQVYELQYQPPVPGEKAGSTHVKNSDGTSTIYHFSKNLLNTTIQYFGQDGELKKEKIYTWNDNNWLNSIELRDGQKNPLYKKSYEYDAFGNPTLEVFTGDVTGSGHQESYTLRKEFSQDGRNLCLKEEYENGKTICYSYLPNTNLVTAKITKDPERPILRELSQYDDCYNLIQSISDDGTQRIITKYSLLQVAPFLHMPEVIEEKYLDNGTEILLKRSHLTYDTLGNVALEEIHDANGELAYTVSKEYNERGDLLSETNSLGQKANYEYDSKGNYISATNFSGRLQKSMRYDAKGRLLQQIETGDDGICHRASFEYDFQDHLIQKTDHFDNTTRYTYDPLVNQVSKTNFPLGIATHSTYDPFGREISKTDANGNKSSYRYSAYGSIVEAIYPDGEKERFLYEKDGTLASYTNQDGLTVRYKRDVLGRALSITYVSKDDETLAQETFTYNGFNLLSKTDKEGHLIKYTYDGAGRKVREEISRRVTDYGYDALNRLSTICAYNGDNTLITHYNRDLQGKIIEEKKTDAFGQVLYKVAFTYDADGNKATVNREKSVDFFKYDSFGRLIEHVDPCLFVTKRTYNENYVNPLGQRVLQTTILDPRNISTIEIRDVFNRIVKKEVVDPSLNTLSSEELIYDPSGNQLFQKDHVYENGEYLSTKTIGYTYSPTHKIESLTKAYGTRNSSTTHYTYYGSGKIRTKTLPDGTTLSHEYNPLGFLSRLTSSNDKIHQTFRYDNLGHLTYAADNNMAIKRTFDAFGNVTQEVFPSQLVVNKEYDDFNRVISLKIPGNAEVTYSYDTLFLREVTRLSDSGDTLYTHLYEDYDLDGNLLSEKLIGNLGEVTHAYDKRGLKTSISSPYFDQNCFYDSAQNLIETVMDLGKYDYTYDGLSQLSQETRPNKSSMYAHDSLYNRTKKDSTTYQINDLNQLLPFSYDANGNQTTKHAFQLIYDPLNRLIEATSQEKKIVFFYDALGRRLNKMVITKTEEESEDYLYNGPHEIGAFVSKTPKNFRVLGLDRNNSPQTIAIELEEQIFAPIIDVQGNVRKLIDIRSHAIADSYDFTAFGEELTEATLPNPWRFASKRFDSELGLIYFGKRYYDPEFARWLTQDPAGFIDSTNLYQYVLNNPFRYRDPYGENLWGFVCGIGQIVAGGFVMASGAVLEVASFGGYTFAFGVHEACGLALMTSGCAMASYHAQDIQIPNISWKNMNPFDGPVDGEIFVGDVEGNIIPVSEGHQIGGSEDGTWLEVKNGKKEPTGLRKDGKGHPQGPKHPNDYRSWEPHAHVPGVTNPDGTPWLPIY